MRASTNLNEAQKAAILKTEGPLLVLAGAGAGKTRVIVERILEIVRRGTEPRRILAITFTNKAAGEMRERVMRALQTQGENQGSTLTQGSQGRTFLERRLDTPFVSTFHSLGLAIIKENFRLLGMKRAPYVYDRADSLREIKLALKSVGGDEVEPRAALGLISRKKGDGVSVQEFAASAASPRERLISSAWLSYERALAQGAACDFDDLLLRATRLLRERDVRERYQQRWSYLHIDEYQDTNLVQAEMAQLLLGVSQNLCAVGDIDQTIYGWRGAQIANLLSFEKTFPGASIIILEENYRSTQNILAAANEIISKNVFRREKNLYTKNREGEKISLYQAFDETDEAAFVARKILELLLGGAWPKDIAVLYRANFQSRAIEEQLLAAEIPHQVLGTKFFERKEVKDVLAFVRLAMSEADGWGNSIDLARVANVPPRGIGKVTLLKMLARRESELSGAMREKILRFHALVGDIRKAAETLPPSKLIEFVMRESGMEKMFKEDKFEGAERIENVRELAALAARYDPSTSSGQARTNLEGLELFLESAALASDQDELKEEMNAVRLMTVHAAKGLEFRFVFVTGLEEGLFPYEREADTAQEREEERRLMYVALTRAKEKVFLSYASYRTMFGSKNATLPSQFLSDLPEELVELESPERLGKTIYLD